MTTQSRLNQQPPLVLVDPAPLASTAAGGIFMDGTPQQQLIKSLTSIDSFKFQRVFHDIITLDLTNQTATYSYEVVPNSVELSWRDLVTTLYQYAVFEEDHEFTAMFPDEVKGQLRFDVYEHIRNNMDYSTTRLLNRHEYWDLQKQKIFKLHIAPAQNLFTHQRWFPPEDRGNVQKNMLAYVNTTATPNTYDFLESQSYATAFSNQDKDRFAKFQMVVDKRLQWSPAAPTTIDILHTSVYTMFEGWGLKSYPETVGSRSYVDRSTTTT